MAELYLVRHAQASFGSTNYDKLSPLGQQQSVWLGEYYQQRGIKFDSIVTGAMVRHRETAKSICHGLNIKTAEFDVLDELNEFDFQALVKAYIGKHPEDAIAPNASASEHYRLLKKTLHCWSLGKLSINITETWQQFEQRVQWALGHIQEKYHGQKVLAVSSGGAISMALRQIIQAPSKTAIELNMQIKNTAVSHFFFNSRAFRLTTFNHVPHLDSLNRLDKVTFS